MAVKSNNVIIHSGHKTDLWEIPVASATVLAQADLIEVNANLATAVNSADNTVFAGLAEVGSNNGQTEPLAVWRKCIFRGTMAAGEAVGIGNAASYSAGANGTDWTFADNTAEGIVWAYDNIAAGGSGRFINDLAMLAKSIFETVTT